MFVLQQAIRTVVSAFDKFATGFGIDREETFEETAVVIVGGGAAGIAAAKALYEANINFLLLEADERIGGRIKNQQFGDYMVENGANWIHGLYTADDPPMNNPIWDFKNQLNIVGNFTDYKNAKCVMTNGTNINDAIVKKCWHQIDEAKVFCSEISNALREEAERKKLKVPESIDMTLKDCLEQFGYNNRTVSNIEKQVAKTVEYVSIDLDISIPSENASLMLNFALYHLRDYYVGGDFFITDQRGYAIFLEEIAKPFFKFLRLRH